MSYDYENLDELAGKIDYEGGLLEAAFGYGIKHTAIKDTDQTHAVRELWAQMEIIWHRDMEPIVEEIRRLLPDEYEVE